MNQSNIQMTVREQEMYYTGFQAGYTRGWDVFRDLISKTMKPAPIMVKLTGSELKDLLKELN